MTLKLKGMTWSHPRGYDPMVHCSTLFMQETGIEVSWDKRSLQDFESFPVEELAKNYDLIVIDHPHVGQITASECLVPLDSGNQQGILDEYLQHSVGPSYKSYFWKGQQWALPIDAAAQVQAYRPDIISQPPKCWEEIIELAKNGQVILPLRSPHALMCFYTLAANQGCPCNTGDGDLINMAEGVKTYRLLDELVSLLDPQCFEMDPIAALEAMSAPNSSFAVMPYGYGYVSYALEGFRPNLLAFSDIPSIVRNGVPAGSVLGGTGIAVSALSEHREEAMKFAYWIASSEVQRLSYAASGGQPGHAMAWHDKHVNLATHGFYSNTLSTLETSFVRPRHNGYMHFQNAASERLSLGLKKREQAETVITDINALYKRSRNR
ncbi:ABC transporter substrate-binding protein [Halomonas sp. KO116]|uniref:ABC transporter substrate-binding protein n=1 Tax=Halomonas sp. KO116 TaxID=1504981 RepID=UPI0005559D4F|nr:extracellular solute-binding protein [Halomonas sp. KO116]